jgi:nucleoid-associated protein YgaU
MGHFEKVAVLMVISCVTVILVVTLNEDGQGTVKLSMGEETESRSTPEDPRVLELSSKDSKPVEGLDFAPGEDGGKSNPRFRSGGTKDRGFVRVEAPAPDTTGERSGLTLQDLANAEKGQESRGELFLDDNFSAPEVATGEFVLPAGADLLTLVGLSSSWEETIMEYTWQRGDSWTSLAKRFYGDTEKSALLRQFTEGATHMAAGTVVLVPVFDLRTQNGVRTGAGGTDVQPVASAPREELSEERGTLYTVVEGDSLWDIAAKVYQDGSEWEKIYEANQDILKKPESVQVGMGLRIP